MLHDSPFVDDKGTLGEYIKWLLWADDAVRSDLLLSPFIALVHPGEMQAVMEGKAIGLYLLCRKAQSTIDSKIIAKLFRNADVRGHALEILNLTKGIYQRLNCAIHLLLNLCNSDFYSGLESRTN